MHVVEVVVDSNTIYFYESSRPVVKDETLVGKTFNLLIVIIR